jgi:signal transduction histidine kinase
MTGIEVGLAVAVAVLAVAFAVVLVLLRRARNERTHALASRAAAVEAQQRVAELAVAAERLRILREMHDVIAHSLAIMIAQADGGSYVTADAAAAQRAFTTIAETGRGALADTRRILGILKHGETDPSKPGEPDLAPVPEADLDRLAASFRRAGLEVAIVRVGEPRPLPSGARMALYRIAQEALTNVVKHAGVEANVVLAENWQPAQVSLTITSSGGTRAKAVDPVTGSALPGLGLGLIGMRERAELVGGTLVAGPTDAGFSVAVTIPFRLEEDDD